MLSSGYKKTIANTFYHIAVLVTGALLINYSLEKGKIVRKTELKLDTRDTGKLFLYLSAGEFIRQKIVDMGWIPASLMPK